MIPPGGRTALKISGEYRSRKPRETLAAVHIGDVGNTSYNLGREDATMAIHAESDMHEGEGDELGTVHEGGHGYVADKQRVTARLKRIEGQVRAVTRMIEDDTYCIDVLTQISACDKALKSVALILLDDHLNHCVRTAVKQGGDVADDKLREAEDAIARLVRS